MLAALAMLSVFTLCARVAAPAAVLTPSVSSGTLPTRQGLASELAPLIASRSLGPHVGVAVTDLASGSVLFARAAGAPATPASSAKLATAVAALSVLGPAARFTTHVA